MFDFRVVVILFNYIVDFIRDDSFYFFRWDLLRKLILCLVGRGILRLILFE